MILWLVSHFANLSLRHYLMIAVTIVVPVVVPTVMGYFPIECLWVRVLVDVGVILVWSVFVVVVVSRLVQREVSEASQSVADRVDPVAEQVRVLGEEHDNSIRNLGLQVEDLESRAQLALQSLGAELPPKTVNLRASFRAGSPTMSATLSVSGGSRRARIRARFRRVRRRAWEIVWGKR